MIPSVNRSRSGISRTQTSSCSSISSRAGSFFAATAGVCAGLRLDVKHVHIKPLDIELSIRYSFDIKRFETKWLEGTGEVEQHDDDDEAPDGTPPGRSSGLHLHRHAEDCDCRAERRSNGTQRGPGRASRAA